MSLVQLYKRMTGGTLNNHIHAACDDMCKHIQQPGKNYGILQRDSSCSTTASVVPMSLVQLYKRMTGGTLNNHIYAACDDMCKQIITGMHLIR